MVSTYRDDGSFPCHIDELEFFREATLNICGSLRMEDVLSSCLKFLKQTIPAFGMTIDLYNEELNTFNVIGIASPEGIHEVNLTFHLPPELRYLAEWHEESSIRNGGVTQRMIPL